MLTHYSTKLLTPAQTKAAPGTPVAVCPNCGVRGHETAVAGRRVVAGCRCGRRPLTPVRPSEGNHA